MKYLQDLQDWYLLQCNGDWEHGLGIEIRTLDNPGWSVDINLIDTNLEGMPFDPVEFGIGPQSKANDHDWYTAKIEDRKFKGRSGPLHLEKLLRIFLDWDKQIRTMRSSESR